MSYVLTYQLSSYLVRAVLSVPTSKKWGFDIVITLMDFFFIELFKT